MGPRRGNATPLGHARDVVQRRRRRLQTYYI